MTADSPLSPVDLAREADFPLGDLRVRPSVRQVERGGDSETLEPRIMQVLVALGRRRGEVVSRDDLITLCWEGRAVSDDALNRCISRLRKLGEASDAFELETIPRVGYRLTAGEAVAKRPAPVAEDRRGDVSSLLVLPFANRSGLAEDQVFADGMVEDVIDAMAQGVHVRVFGGVVTTSLRGAPVTDFTALGARLGADLLLEGNVRRAGADLRVTAQLVEAATGQVIWSGRFERALAELAALQEELVLEIAGALGVEVHLLDMQNALKKPGDLTAWEALHRAMAGLRQTDPASLMTAIAEAKRATEIAPDFATGHAVLAAASGVAYFIMSPSNPAEEERIAGLARHALALGADDAFVLSNAAGALAMVGKARESVASVERALRKAPGLGPAHYVAGTIYTLLDRTDDACVHFDIADRLMPVTYMQVYIRDWRSVAMVRARRWQEAERLCDESLAMNPHYPMARLTKAVLSWLAQRRDAARAEFAAVRAMGLPVEIMMLLYSRSYAGNPAGEEMLTALRDLAAEAA